MDLLQSLLALMTPIGIAVFALLITREGQKDRASENARRDARDEADRQQRVKDNQQFMILFATITGKQIEGTTAVTAAVEKSGLDTIAKVESSGKSVGKKVEGARDTIVEQIGEYRDGIEETKEIMIMMFDLLAEDPPATRSRIKRMAKAWVEGDVQGAQTIADEDVPQAADATPAVDGDEESEAAA